MKSAPWLKLSCQTQRLIFIVVLPLGQASFELGLLILRTSELRKWRAQSFENDAQAVGLERIKAGGSGRERTRATMQEASTYGFKTHTKAMENHGRPPLVFGSGLASVLLV